MSIQELSNEFDVLYNSISTNQAPGLDIYEKSVYLTKAQLEIVKNYYNPTSNSKNKGFEGSEKRRVDLKELVVDYKTDNSTFNLMSSFLSETTSDIKINENSRFFVLPDNVFLMISESVTVKNKNCEPSTFNIKVKAVTHDEYHLQIKNPFKTPDKNISWRLNISKIGNTKAVEILSNYEILKYNLRYLKYPKPIILGNLNTLFPGEGLSIDGLTSPNTCQLDKEIHPEILNRAVELAWVDYKSPSLEAKVQLNQRNE